MGRRSRKRPPAGAVPAAPRPPRKSSEEKNAEIRAQLEPLAPGERPGWVTVAAVLATLMTLGNLALILAGYELDEDSSTAVGVGQTALLGVIAVGLWLAKYWAVLGFVALLALTALIGFLSLTVAGNVLAALLAIVLISGPTFLLYKLIRAMARIQMPRRPGAEPPR